MSWWTSIRDNVEGALGAVAPQIAQPIISKGAANTPQFALASEASNAAASYVGSKYTGGFNAGSYSPIFGEVPTGSYPTMGQVNGFNAGVGSAVPVMNGGFTMPASSPAPTIITSHVARSSSGGSMTTYVILGIVGLIALMFLGRR
ncbi:MAG: hypothetical protein ACYCPX_12745 [Acidiferrobacteraceae bacterium]